jgi:hypothetical protein
MVCSAVNPFFFILTPYTYSQSYSKSSPGPIFAGRVMVSTGTWVADPLHLRLLRRATVQQI